MLELPWAPSESVPPLAQLWRRPDTAGVLKLFLLTPQKLFVYVRIAKYMFTHTHTHTHTHTLPILIPKNIHTPYPGMCNMYFIYKIGKYKPAAAKLLQSCPTLCDPIDGSPPGSPVPGILQARTLEWVAISFSNA